MSDEPVVAQKFPYVLTLAPGSYYWCACGRSSKQPFCDGSHKGSTFSPVQFKVEKPTTVAICGCKHTATPPFCDGSHSRVGGEAPASQVRHFED